jgi:hypothetical protein
VVRDALALVGRRKSASHWDAEGHQEAVKSGLQKVLIERSLARQSELDE